jgi:drug/metabolite transporter (DMT)-like permease
MAADTPAARRTGYALVAAAAVGWGTWPLILRRAPMHWALQSTVLMVVVSLASLPLMAKDRVRVRARVVDWVGVAWLGVADALNVGLFFAAYQRTTVAIAVLTHYLTPIFIALAAPFVLRERLLPRTMLAVGIAFGGLVLLLAPWRTDLSSNDLVGAALGAGSAVFYASNVLINKRLVHAFSGSELMFFHCFVGIPLLGALVPAGALAATSSSALIVVFLGALGPGALSGLMFVWGLRRIAASHASVLTLIEPFVAVVVAALFLSQPLRFGELIGGALILLGAVLVVTQKEHVVADRS